VEKEMEKVELKASLRVFFVGLVVPFIIVNLLAFSSQTVAGLHVLGWGQLILTCWIVLVAIFYDKTMERIKKQF